MLIPAKEMNAKIPDIDGDKTKIYFLDDQLLAKRFILRNDASAREKLERYVYINKINNLNNVSLPVDILETENGFCGYIEKILPGTLNGKLKEFTQYCRQHRYDLTLKDIADYFLKCCEIINSCHENGIVIPDLATDGSILINEDNFGVYLTNYQDMQVGNIKSNNVSSFIIPDPILLENKYYHRGIYTPNIDLYTLTTLFFCYATKINIPICINDYSIDELIRIGGIENTYFAYCIRNLYNLGVDNIDIRTAIEELSSEYQLSPYKVGKIRKLEKKR